MFGEKNTLHSSLRISILKKHDGGSIIAWACFAASWPGQPVIIDGTMNSEQ